MGISIKTLLSAVMLSATCMGITAQTMPAEIIESVRKQMAPDKRQTVYEVTIDTNGSAVTGKVSDRTVYEALAERLSAEAPQVNNQITLLPDTLWGIVRLSVACMRSQPKYSSELSTQAIMGMPVRLLEYDNGWWRIQSPDGYIGWVWRSSVTPKSVGQMQQWRNAPRLVVISLRQLDAYVNAETLSPREIVTDLLPGNIVEGTMDDVVNGRVRITLPDGRQAWADAQAFAPVEQWAAQDFNPEVIMNQAYAMMGAPYLWGGTSAKMTDCSGLVKISYLANGIMLRRDASQQALTGQKLSPEDWRDYQTADLMFFAEKPQGRVTHVALYDHDGMFVHCAGLVHRSSIDPDSPDYAKRIFLGGSRINGSIGTDGITYVRDHPWYF